MPYNGRWPLDAPGDRPYHFAQSEDSIGSPQANDRTEREPRIKDSCDGKQGPKKPNSQQQAEAIGERKEGAQGEKGCCKAARPLARGGRFVAPDRPCLQDRIPIGMPLACSHAEPSSTTNLPEESCPTIWPHGSKQWRHRRATRFTFLPPQHCLPACRRAANHDRLTKAQHMSLQACGQVGTPLPRARKLAASLFQPPDFPIAFTLDAQHPLGAPWGAESCWESKVDFSHIAPPGEPPLLR